MSNAANAALASPWKDLWNGDLDVISQIIAEDFVAHAAPLTGTGTTEMHGRQALSGWVSSCGGKRKATTVAASRAPTEAIGRHASFTGTDILRIADGKLAEYWANTDSLLFFQQLGVREVPAG